MKKIYIVGMGPGDESMMTVQALKALDGSEVIIGYTVYTELLGERFKDKEILSTPMKKEIERCRLAFEKAAEGKRVSIICSGDAGVYGLASLMYELLDEYPGAELEVVCGVTAALSGAALLGAPINHDFCVISLSDLLTPWDKIEKRVRSAVMGDFAMVFYNPSSRKRREHLKKICDIILESVGAERACGIAVNIGRSNSFSKAMTLSELRDTEVDMFTTVFIGNSESYIRNGKLITSRALYQTGVFR